MIRNYIESDITEITKLGSFLHKNYKFKLDVFSKCLVCVLEEKLVGFIVYSIMYERAEIIDIVVDSDYRERGYGKCLISAALDEIKSNKCQNVTLEVSSGNAIAIKFYSNFGFKKVREIKSYYFDIESNVCHDAYLMELKF